MKECFKSMQTRNFFTIQLLIFLIVTALAVDKWPAVLLLIAQLVYVPVLFREIVAKSSVFRRLFPWVAIPAYVAVGVMAIFPSKWDGVLSVVYLLLTLFIASYGLVRFIHRGFTHMEEFAIDCGFIFLLVGGLWFVAFHFGIDTGFSPLITWLTAIHFHYSSFMMLIFVGLLGRVRKTKYYPVLAGVLIILPWVMAAGITLSPWIEIVGVTVYIASIGSLIVYSIRTHYANFLQRFLVNISFGAVGMTIIFALLYVLSNGFGMPIVTIGWMLVFHGITNASIFGLLGLTGWMCALPPARFVAPTFPLSPIREKFLAPKGSAVKAGLVEDLSVYLQPSARRHVSRTIADFYERTEDYRLFAEVQWKRWFLPFAFVYKGVSRLLEQINLPLRSQEVEMKGAIIRVDEGVGGRDDVRAWIRKVGKEQVFAALYSSYSDGVRTYMNIALPLPFTSMHGILALEVLDESLLLTSEQSSDSQGDMGIYLAFCTSIRFRLPLAETFIVKEGPDGSLQARHDMSICGIPFLAIHYRIEKSVL